MLHIQASAVEGAVGKLSTQNAREGHHAALLGMLHLLYNEPNSTGPHDHTISLRSKRNRGLSHVIFRCRRTCSQESRTKPGHHSIIGDSVRTDHKHAITATLLNPVIGHGYSHSRTGACGIHSRGWTAKPQELSELSMTHR